jgi:MFS family permease
MAERTRADIGRTGLGDRRENLWRSGDFLKLWGGETVSQIGTQITVLALPLTAIFVLRATPLQLGLLTAAQFAPIFIITPFAGVWLDTHPHRPVLIVANIGRAALFGLVPVLFAFDLLTMGALYAIGFLAGLLTASFDVAYMVYLPSLVRRESLVEANAKLEATYSISEVGGPGLGGLLVQTLTAPVAILADAVTYLMAAVAIGRIRRPEPAPRPRGPTSTWRDLREGMAVTVRHPILSPMVVQSACFNLFHQAILTLYVLYGVRDLHLSPGQLGTILTMGSLGGLLGTYVAASAARRFGMGRTIVGSMMLASTALVLIPAAGGPKPAAVLTLLAGLVLYGLGLAVFNVHSLSLRAALIPHGLRGRVTGSYRLISNGAIPLGSLLGGFLGEEFGVRGAMVIAVVPLILTSVVFAFTRVRDVSDDLLPDSGLPSEPSELEDAADGHDR